MKRLLIAVLLVLLVFAAPVAQAHGPNFLNFCQNGVCVHCHGTGGNSNETYVETDQGAIGVHFTGPGNPTASHLILPESPAGPAHNPTPGEHGACATP